MVAEKPDPQPPQCVRALQHHLHQPARMGVAVKAERKLQNVLEIAGQDDVAAAVREAVGVKSDQRAAGDGEKPEAGPGGQQHSQSRPRRRLAASLRAGQRVDDAAEQHRLGKLRGGQRHIRQRQRPCQSALGPEQSENAAIKTKNAHVRISIEMSTSTRQIAAYGFRAARFLKKICSSPQGVMT